jgi:hypothetical protein
MRPALRTLGREKAFAAFAVLTLALGSAPTRLIPADSIAEASAYKERALHCGCGVRPQTLRSIRARYATPSLSLFQNNAAVRVRGVAESRVFQPDR